tara:strand:- start:4133 stop:4423 length:291 start_codon:yes stop_codon:yes gene_type:complete
MINWFKKLFSNKTEDAPKVEESAIRHWSEKTMGSTVKKVGVPRSVLVTAKAKKAFTKTELSKMTKKDLETLGRKHGIELDRRLVKSKLVSQLHKKL